MKKQRKRRGGREGREGRTRGKEEGQQKDKKTRYIVEEE